MKNRVICAFLVIVLFVTIAVSFKHIISTNYILVSATPIESKLIIIDAGHGGIDGGAIGKNNILEKDINLAIARKLETMLTSCGFEVIMTRTTDEMVGEELPKDATIRQKKVGDTKARVKLINSHPHAVVLSIHQNLFSDSKYCGAQMFYSTKNADSKTLATFLQNRFSTMLQTDNERKTKPVADSIYIMNHISVPAVLVECGFISNYIEATNLTNDEYQNKITFVIYAALCDYFSYKV